MVFSAFLCLNLNQLSCLLGILRRILTIIFEKWQFFALFNEITSNKRHFASFYVIEILTIILFLALFCLEFCHNLLTKLQFCALMIYAQSTTSFCAKICADFFSYDRKVADFRSLCDKINSN